MAENTSISWATHSFNPWWGCTKVGPGCDHCYAESFDKRVGGDHWGAGKPRREVKDWSKPRKWNREAEKTGVRPWVFCASMADVFDNEVSTEWRDRLWALVRETPFLNWIFVTKRIGNAAKMLPADWPAAFGHCGICITVTDQNEADRDISKLVMTPAAWRGISAEPLLGPIDFNIIPFQGVDALDWVIVGGESGPGARPMHPAWAREIRNQCVEAGVSFHFKQWGEWHPYELIDGVGYPMPGHAPFDSWRAKVFDPSKQTGWDWRRLGKKAAGRLLDGVEHNGMPPARSAVAS